MMQQNGRPLTPEFEVASQLCHTLSFGAEFEVATYHVINHGNDFIAKLHAQLL